MEGGDENGGADDDGVSGDESATAPPPTRPQSQHELTFQLGVNTNVSPPSSSSSTFSAVPSNSLQQTMSFGSFQVSTPTRMQTGGNNDRPRAAKDGASTGTFQVMMPMAMASTSSAAVRRPVKQVRTSSTKTATEDASGPRTPLPAAPALPLQPFVVSAVSETVSPAESGDINRQASKRKRIDSDSSERDFAWTWPISPSTGSGSLSAPSPRQPLPLSGFVVKVPLDAPSPFRGEDAQQRRASPHATGGLLHYQATNDFRRLSVSSLLSGPFDPNFIAGSPQTNPTVHADEPLTSGDTKRDYDPHHNNHRSSYFFGIDAGFQDLDLGKNDDANALSGVRSSTKSGKSNGFEQTASANRDPCGYYSKPVFVRIPRALGILPPKLTENPMNMLVRLWIFLSNLFLLFSFFSFLFSSIFPFTRLDPFILTLYLSISTILSTIRLASLYHTMTPSQIRSAQSCRRWQSTTITCSAYCLPTRLPTALAYWTRRSL